MKDDTESYRLNAKEVKAGLASDLPLVINRTRRQIGSGMDELFHPGDCGHLTKEDVAAMHYHAKQHGFMEDDELQWRIHSRFVLGANVLCWGAGTVTPSLVQRILQNKGWPDDHLVGVKLAFDESLPADEFHLEKRIGETDVIPIGMIKTTFQLNQDGPE